MFFIGFYLVEANFKFSSALGDIQKVLSSWRGAGGAVTLKENKYKQEKGGQAYLYCDGFFKQQTEFFLIKCFAVTKSLLF